ncbi:MAG: hypothetical protein EA425_05770 [Puniceicoccaceae bacterium]|nr:MAG: hypothetical protein EA425_05770 [Puniceicoccaceae bacterium]
MRKAWKSGEAEESAFLNITGLCAFVGFALLGAFAEVPLAAVWGGLGILTFAWIGYFFHSLKQSYLGVGGFFTWYLPVRDDAAWRIIVGHALRTGFDYPLALGLSLGILLYFAPQATWEAYLLAGLAGVFYVLLLRDSVVVLDRLGWRLIAQVGVVSGGVLICGMFLATIIPLIGQVGLQLLEQVAVWLPTSWFFLGLGRLMSGETLAGLWMVALTTAAFVVFRMLARHLAKGFTVATLSDHFGGGNPVIVERPDEPVEAVKARWEAGKSPTKVAPEAKGSALTRWTNAVLNGEERRALSLLTMEPGASSPSYGTGAVLVLVAAIVFYAPAMFGPMLPGWVEWGGWILLFGALICVYPFGLSAWPGMNTMANGARKTTLVAHYPVSLWTALRSVLKIHAMHNLLALPLMLVALAALRYGLTAMDGAAFSPIVHFVYPPVLVLCCSLGSTACSALEIVRPTSSRPVYQAGLRLAFILGVLVAFCLLAASFVAVVKYGGLAVGVFLAIASAGCVIGCAFVKFQGRRDLIFAAS